MLFDVLCLLYLVALFDGCWLVVGVWLLFAVCCSLVFVVCWSLVLVASISLLFVVVKYVLFVC